MTRAPGERLLPPFFTAGRHLWLVPCLWAINSVFGFFHHGDEYAMFVAGSIAGMWAGFLVGGNAPLDFLLPVVAAGVGVMATAGWCLDCLRSPTWLWPAVTVTVAIVLLVVATSNYESVERMRGKHGSIQAFIHGAAGMGMTLATALLVPTLSVVRLVGHFKRRRNAIA